MNLGGVNSVMAVLGFSVLTLIIAFVCIRYITTRAQSGTFPISAHSASSSLEDGFRGIEPQVVANFPTEKYGDKSFFSSDDSQCVICLAEYCKDDVMRILPYCDHFFHVLCIDKWLSQHSTCPVCRISLREYISSVDLYFNSSSIQGHQMRGNNDRRGDIIRESLLLAERPVAEAGEDISIVIEGSKNEHTESSSNTR